MEGQPERRARWNPKDRERVREHQRRWTDIQQRSESERIREELHDATAVTVDARSLQNERQE